MDDNAQESLVPALLADVLEPLFWPPARLGVDSAWLGHVPFGHWLVAAHRPASVVELGTRSGVSFAAFCEAALRCGIDTHARAFAMPADAPADTLAATGDRAGCAALRGFLDQRYAAALLSPTPAQALDIVPDASVDLLHINATPPDQDVAGVFACWRPKLSSRAIVLIHAINPDRTGCAWRFWTEISARHAHFTFDHADGLGMLIAGELVSGAARQICGLRGEDAARLRQRFFVVGRQWAALRALDREAGVSAGLQAEMLQLRSGLAACHEEIAAQKAARIDAEAHAARLASEVDRLTSSLQAAHAELGAFSQEIIAYEHERETFLRSTSWRMTAPLRRLMGKA